jgi:hypothetical protein
MGWLDKLWRQREPRPTRPEEETVEARGQLGRTEDEDVADEAEETMREQRDEEISSEPRKPPLTG